MATFRSNARRRTPSISGRGAGPNGSLGMVDLANTDRRGGRRCRGGHRGARGRVPGAGPARSHTRMALVGSVVGAAAGSR